MNIKYFFKVTLAHLLGWQGYAVPWIVAGIVLVLAIIFIVKPPRRLLKFRALFSIVAIALVIATLWYWVPKWQFKRDTSVNIPSHFSAQEKKGYLDRQNEILRDKESWGKNNSSLYNNIGILRSGMEDYDGAVDSFKKAIRQNPDDPRFWRNLAITYNYLDKYKDAESAFLHAFKIAPNAPEYWLELGELYQFKLKDNATTRSFYLEALSRNVNNISVAQAFAKFLEDVEKDYVEAVKYWQMVADGAPENNKLPFLKHIQELKLQYGIK